MKACELRSFKREAVIGSPVRFGVYFDDYRNNSLFINTHEGQLISEWLVANSAGYYLVASSHVLFESVDDATLCLIAFS